MANTKSRKASGKLSKVLRAFNPRSFRGGMALFALVFAFTGGGYMLYRSFAASLPPSNLRNGVSFWVTATDGYYGSMSCVTVSAQTAYGPVVRCSQTRNWSEGRVGFYSPLTNKFSPDTGWMKESKNGAWPWGTCKNMGYYFIGVDVYDTAYGGVLFGQIYRYANNRWEIKWANMSSITRNCSTTGNWSKALPFK